MKKREKQEVIPRAKGKKRLSLKLRRGERPGLHSQGRERKRFEHNIKGRKRTS